MKRLALIFCVVLVSFWSVASLAASVNVGMVDIQKIFKTSPQVQKINKDLDSQFSDRKQSLQKMAKDLKASIGKLQKNQTVMSSDNANKLKQSIVKQESAFRTKQAQFQQALFAAQNKAMKSFMDKVHAAAKAVAVQKKLDLVLSNNGVLYNRDNIDITSDILEVLQ